jgi:hypothetical protein
LFQIATFDAKKETVNLVKKVLYTSPVISTGVEPVTISHVIALKSADSKVSKLCLDPSEWHVIAVICIEGTCSVGLAPSTDVTDHGVAVWSCDESMSNREVISEEVIIAHELVYEEAERPQAIPKHVPLCAILNMSSTLISQAGMHAIFEQYLWLFFQVAQAEQSAQLTKHKNDAESIFLSIGAQLVCYTSFNIECLLHCAQAHHF